MALTSEFPETAVFIAGHTHQIIPSRITMAYSSRSGPLRHFMWRSISLRSHSKKLLHRESGLRVHGDRLSFGSRSYFATSRQLTESDAALAQPIERIGRNFSRSQSSGAPSDLERLIVAAIAERCENVACRRRGDARRVRREE